MIYCVVPRDLVATLHEPLREFFGDQPGVEVVVERRTGERRAGERRGEPPEPRPDDRRRIKRSAGRRRADRRASAALATPPALPPEASEYASQLRFVEIEEGATQQQEDLETARLVRRIQAGDQALFEDLYLRYFDRVYGYLRLAVRDHQEAEDLAQDVFMNVLEAIGRYQFRGRPFRAWLFRIARNRAINHLGRPFTMEPTDPESLERALEATADPSQGPADWLSDRAVVALIENLPDLQRQILALRFLVGLDTPEIAVALERSEEAVRQAQSRALRSLRSRLGPLRESFTSVERHPMRRLVHAPIR